jgi:hypothetical protein
VSNINFSKRLKKIADNLEELRVEVCKSRKLDYCDYTEFNDTIFKYQSDLRYNFIPMLEAYEEII